MTILLLTAVLVACSIAYVVHGQPERKKREAEAHREQWLEWKRLGGPHGERHQAERKRWADIIASHEVQCSERICIMPSRTIPKGAASSFWHLAHDHNDGRVSSYLGPAHAVCNQYEALLRRQRERRAPWPGAPTIQELLDEAARARKAQERVERTAHTRTFPEIPSVPETDTSAPPQAVEPATQQTPDDSEDLWGHEGPKPQKSGSSKTPEVMSNQEYVDLVMRVASAWESAKERRLFMHQIHELRRSDQFPSLLGFARHELVRAARTLDTKTVDVPRWVEAAEQLRAAEQAGRLAAAELEKENEERRKGEEANRAERQAAAYRKLVEEFARPGESFEDAAARMVEERRKRAEQKAREWQMQRPFSRETER